MLEFKVKVKIANIFDLDKTIEKINEIEKEYRCNCTLLEIEIG